MQKILLRFEEHLKSNYYAANTIKSYYSDLKVFLNYLQNDNIDLYTFTSKDLQNFFTQKSFFNAKTQARYICSIREYCVFLIKEKHRLDNPVSQIDRPKMPKSLPKYLNEQEILRLLDAPNLNTDLGCRDKAMLEVLFATGLRISELINLKFDEYNSYRKVFTITGKGNKTRYVIASDRAIKYLELYIKNSRSRINPNVAATSNYLFLPIKSSHCEYVSREAILKRIKFYAQKANITKDVTLHLLRHSFATYMLNNGMNLREIQTLLGHSNIATTTVYTSVSDHKLKQEFNEIRKKF